MKYENRLLAFIDILGWADLLVKSTFEESLIKKISEIVDKINEVGKRDKIWIDSLTEEQKKFIISESYPKYSQFSDTIVMTSPANYGGASIMYYRIKDVCEGLLKMGILTRGSVVYGEIMHTDDQLFGPALVKAYKIESKTAIYPRIICDDSVFPYFHQPTKNPDSETIFYDRYLRKDFDQLIYFDILGGIGTGFTNEKRTSFHNHEEKLLNEAKIRTQETKDDIFKFQKNA